MCPFLRRAPLIAAALIFPLAAAAAEAPDAALSAALAAPGRSAANVARDRYRHPAETLAFFGLEPDDNVVELWPGGGWYTEILAPYLAERGKLTVVPPTGRYTETIQKKMAGDPVYVKVAVVPVEPGSTSAVPAGSADLVLTFRNIHNWMMADTPYAEAVFADAFRMLKPGGTLGIAEHRLPESADTARERSSGYIKTSTVRRLAEQAGFRFVESSEVNANPKDTADWPDGVWTLPPTLRNGDADRDKYLAIGESDRMTLKFVKPE